MTTVTIATITLKSLDPKRLADFWMRLLGYRQVAHPTDSIRLDDPSGRGPTLLIQPSGGPPRAGTIHVDLLPDDHGAAVTSALHLGATRVDIGQEGDEGWVVLADPDGNVFCLLSDDGDEPERSREADVIAASDDPVVFDDVVAALAAAGVGDGDTVIVHSSLSRLGWVVGGPQTVVAGLLAAVGPEGTIVMPAQTGVSDPSTWANPPVPESWWPTIREHWPAFDPNLTPLRGMGAVVECFSRLPGAVRSGHPSVGFVAHGPKANAIVHPHRLIDGLGDDSPLGRLHDIDAAIALIGVGHGNNTSLHLAEYRADYPGKRTTTMGAPLIVDGERAWVSYEDIDHDEEDFEDLGEAFVAGGGVERRVALGSGEVVTCSMREIVDFAVDWMTANRTSTA